MDAHQTNYPLYLSSFEHDACGIGAVISIQGKQTHRTVDDALKIVEKLQHRAGKDACGETGDGVGIMIQIPHRLMQKAAQNGEIEGLGPSRGSLSRTRDSAEKSPDPVQSERDGGLGPARS